jgi:DNA-binding response OmpR family regulator
MVRILIVEDEEHLPRLVAEVLGREGHAAETVGDGRAALARALVEPFDLLVVDWMVPELDGVQVVKRLRAAGDVTLDPSRHEVRRAGERIDLTAKEFALLATLMQRPGQIFTRSVLLDTVWGGTTGAYTNVVDLYVHYLRKKLDRAEETSHIRTVHGTGYTFDPKPEPFDPSSEPRSES